MTPPLNPQTVEKLAHVRLLHQQGIEQGRRPEPLSAPAVLAFHDAVEMFYVVACEYLGIQISPRADFAEYWPKIAGKVPNLAQRRGMERLNRIRVAYKHHVQIPGARQVEQVRIDVEEFLQANTPLIFDVDYSSLSMVDVVPQSHIRGMLHAATAAERGGNRTEAMGLILQAFHELFDPHQGPTSRALGETPPIRPFELGGRVSRQMSVFDIEKVLQMPVEQTRRAPTRADQSLARQIAQVTEVAVATQTAVRMLALGVDFYRYARFEALTPAYVPTFGDLKRWRASDDYAPSDEEYEYCQQFVIDVALRLGDIERHLVMPSWSVSAATEVASA